VAVSRALCHITGDGDLVPGRGPEGATLLWPYSQSWRTLLRRRDEALVDPVNLFVLGADPEAVMAALAARGWARPADGALHRLWLDGRPRRMSDHAALGDRAARVHLRLWGVARGTLGAAHQEVLDERNRHVVTSWDAARAAAADALGGAGFAPLAPTGVVTRPDVRGVPGDGRAWRLLAPAA
jgi:hypothetical protein